MPTYEDLYLIDLCPGEQFRGRTISRDTVYTDHFTTVAGCDSSATYEISVALATRPEITGPERICAGERASLEVIGAFASYAWSTGNDGDDAPVSAPGTYTLTLTILRLHLELSHDLAVTDLMIDQVMATSPACPGGSSGTWYSRLPVIPICCIPLMVVKASSWKQPLRVFRPEAMNLTVENADGCTETSSATLTAPPALTLTTALPPETTIERGDSFPLNLTTDFAVTEYRWSGASFLSCNDCPAHGGLPTVDTKFRVEAIASGGCSVTTAY